jgi:hypothetical protein
MTATTTPFTEIEKESVAQLQFPDHDVLQDPIAIHERDFELRRALALGNLERSKAKIYFEDDKGHFVVETTVWGVTDKRVILKQGTVIPIKRVHRVSVI